MQFTTAVALTNLVLGLLVVAVQWGKVDIRRRLINVDVIV